MPKTSTSWTKGQSGNPAGRPPGARSRYSEQFFRDLHAEWEVSGAAALRRLAETDPGAYLRLYAGLMSKVVHQEPEPDPFAELSDEELRNVIRMTVTRLQETGFG